MSSPPAVPAACAPVGLTLPFAEHRSLLLATALRIVGDHSMAEDVLADVFVHLLATGRRPRTHGNWRAYLARSVANRALGLMRSRAAEARSKQALLAIWQVQPPPPTPERLTEDAQAHRQVRQALRQLPRRQRQVIVLRYWAGQSEAQIAERLQISRGAVKSHTFRAHTALRTVLGPDGGCFPRAASSYHGPRIPLSRHLSAPGRSRREAAGA